VRQFNFLPIVPYFIMLRRYSFRSLPQGIFSVGQFLSPILKCPARFDFVDPDAVHFPTLMPLSLPAKITHGLDLRPLLARKT
jgi:hypothetical protein